MADTTTAPASTVTFVEIIPAYDPPFEPLPTCPDGSGDLWWDDASYLRYQSYDPPMSEPEQIAYETDSPNYCGGASAFAMTGEAHHSCPCHTPAADRAFLLDPPF